MITLTLRNDKKLYVNPMNIDAIEPASEDSGYTKVYMASGIYSVEEPAAEIKSSVELATMKELRIDAKANADEISRIIAEGIHRSTFIGVDPNIGVGRGPLKKEIRSKGKSDG